MRASGILLPIFSLPGGHGIGCFNQEAYKWIDYLKQAKQSYWQILPLGATSYGDSPYQSFSTFAGNPYFISLDDLVAKNWLNIDELPIQEENTTIDYANLYHTRFDLLRLAFERSHITDNHDFQSFINNEAYWLNDYALFMAIKDYLNGISWQQWPEDIRHRTTDAMNYYTNKLQENITFYKFLQFIFWKQWQKLKAYANSQGISIIGDIPIYVAYDSADTWSNPHLFQLDENLLPTAVAGCPPDGFSADGQLWGNPLYAWEKHAQENFSWWISRISWCYKLYDVVRIDHFRGFDSYYAIPAKDKTARNGEWREGPGMDLFNALEKKLGRLNIIVEDLGYLTPSVKQLLKDTGFPGMKLIQFAFDSREESDYLPHTYQKNCVVYTGTHDNDTIMGWFKTAPKESVKYAKEYLRLNKEEGYNWGTMKAVWGCVGDMAIVPMQDILGIGSEGRMNTPSTLGMNWKWRAVDGQITSALAKKVCKNMEIYCRKRKTKEELEALETAE